MVFYAILLFIRLLNTEEYPGAIKAAFTKSTLQNDIVTCFTNLNLYKPANHLANGPTELLIPFLLLNSHFQR